MCSDSRHFSNLAPYCHDDINTAQLEGCAVLYSVPPGDLAVEEVVDERRRHTNEMTGELRHRLSKVTRRTSPLPSPASRDRSF